MSFSTPEDLYVLEIGKKILGTREEGHTLEKKLNYKSKLKIFSKQKWHLTFLFKGIQNLCSFPLLETGRQG